MQPGVARAGSTLESLSIVATGGTKNDFAHWVSLPIYDSGAHKFEQEPAA